MPASRRRIPRTRNRPPSPLRTPPATRFSLGGRYMRSVVASPRAKRNRLHGARCGRPVATPQARLRIGGCDVLLLGTVAGLVPDAARVRQAFDAFMPEVIALGVPPEDLEALRLLAGTDKPE